MKKLFFNKKILVYIIIFGFSLTSFVPTVFAQTQYQTPVQQNYSAPSQEQDIAPTQQTTKPPLSTVYKEEGQVLGLCDVPVLGDVVCAIKDLPGELFGFIFGKIKDIILEIIKHLLILLASIFGFVGGLAENAFTTNDICNQQGRDSMACTTAVAEYESYTRTIASQPSSGFNMIGFAWMGVATAYQSIPTISPVDYLTYEFKNNILGIQTVSAQGIGTSTLSPATIIELWQKMRNLTYIVMVLILVVIGFLVIFRFRLDPRTTITATMALPRIAIALILITFSFALAGLFIDLIYVIVALIVRYFGIPSNEINPFSIFWATFSSFSSIFAREVWIAAASSAGLGAILALPTFGIGAPAAIVGALAIIGLVLIELIARLILFGIGFFIFFTLLGRFATILILTIFSPLFFLWGALPGQEDTTSGWFRRMTVNAISFPAILLILYIGVNIARLNELQVPQPLWTGGATHLLNFPLLAGYGIMFFATKIPALLEDALRVTPSAHVARAGTGLGQTGQRIPLIGGMFR